MLPLWVRVDNGNKEVLRISQSSNITGASPSDCLVLYPGHLLGESYPSIVIQSVYSTAPVNWVGAEKAMEHESDSDTNSS